MTNALESRNAKGLELLARTVRFHAHAKGESLAIQWLKFVTLRLTLRSDPAADHELRGKQSV